MNNNVRIVKTLVSWFLFQICAALVMAASGFNFTFPVPNQEESLDPYYQCYAFLQLALTLGCIVVYNSSKPRWD